MKQLLKNIFYPKIITTIKTYNRTQFIHDLQAGVIVGIIALPLSIAFGIASGVSPAQGIITGIIAGFIISLLGGSRVQIGGPTGAFIIIIAGIVANYGINGLMIATFMAGFILLLLGICRIGSLIKFIPTPVVVGFTSGIAVIIFTTQLDTMLGLSIPADQASPDFIKKICTLIEYFNTLNYYALAISGSTILIIALLTRYLPKIPAAFIALIVTSVAVAALEYYTDIQTNIATIGSKYQNLSIQFSMPHAPKISWETIQQLFLPAVSIALLGAIESLLSAVVADGMIGGKHRSNTELIAQGIANIASPLFGGIPATGAIARTAANIKNGGRTPFAGIIHALTLLAIVLFAWPLVKWIPMAALAGILAVVAYNMSEWREFKVLLKAPKADVLVLILTFMITILIDLNVAIQVGMVMSVFLFMHRMSQVANVQHVANMISKDESKADDFYERSNAISQFQIPDQVEVFELEGACFFGSVDKIETAIREKTRRAHCIILRLGEVDFIDASGLHFIRRINNDTLRSGGRLILSELSNDAFMTVKNSEIYNLVGEENIIDSFEKSLKSAEKTLSMHKTIAFQHTI